MSSVFSSSGLARMPRAIVHVGLVLLLVVALYWPDAVALAGYWGDQDVNAQAGALIALLAGFLLFRARWRLQQVPVGPRPLACLPLIACAALSLICWRAGILTLQLFFLPPILWLALLSVFGLPTARVAAFAIGFLYFALPGWGLLGPALQHLTAWAVGVIGPIIGLPVTMAATTVLLPGGISFVIEPACSGVDFLTIGLAIATLHGELEGAGLRRRARLIGAMLVTAIVSNWLRVLLIVDIGYRSRMHSALATRDHLALGWVLFACALLVFVWLAGRTGASASVAASGDESPDETLPRATLPREHLRWRQYAVVAIALLAVPSLVYGRLLAVAGGAGEAAFDLPPGHAPWAGPRSATDPLWQPRFAGVHTELRATYQGPEGHAVEVVVIGFPRQGRGVQILNETNSLLGDHGLVIATVALTASGGVPHSEVVALGPRGERSLIWSTIDVGGRLFGEPLSSQLWYGARSLVGPPYTALFALRTPCAASCDAERTVLADFLRANGSALFASLPDAGPGV